MVPTRLDWSGVVEDLDARGFALLPRLLGAPECEALAASYARDEGFARRVIMARHGFGSGEYKYFDYPLPPLVDELRHEIYPRLVPIANRWHEAMGIEVAFPADLEAFLARCHA